MTPVLDDAALARDLAEVVGRRLLEVRAGALTAAALRAAGDREAQQVLATRLRRDRPADEVLSEEAPDPAARLSCDRVWIIDPLDGTREFAEPGRIDWAVHVALWQRGRLVAGAVSLPAEGLCYGTDAPPRVPPREPGPIRIVVSRSRPAAFLPPLARGLDAVLVPLGSAGAKCASVWRGVADAYLHAGGQHEWDSAAPVAVALAAGLHASRLDGSPLRYNQPDSWLPDLLICRPELAEPILARTAALGFPGSDGHGSHGRDAGQHTTDPGVREGIRR